MSQRAADLLRRPARALSTALSALRRVSLRARVAIVLAVVMVVSGLVVFTRLTGADPPIPYTIDDATIAVPAGSGAAGTIRLDASIYVPETATAEEPAPAVLIPHGFGGSKETVRDVAGELAGRGCVVVTWSSRGFGSSGGDIHLMSPDHEVADARALVDWVVNRPEVFRDGDDPRLGVVGSSYGGALALMLAGTDARVDAIVAQATWNDLARALFPESTGAAPVRGVFKQAWTSQLFNAGLLGPAELETEPGCGRFATRICRLYRTAATSGRATPELVRLLREHSPMSVTDRITAPTLLIQGAADTLFTLAEADANARQIAKTGTPVRVAWFSGGHDGGTGSDNDEERIRELTLSWLDHHLWKRAPDPGMSFTFSRITGFDPGEGRIRAIGYESPTYPGLDGGPKPTAIPLIGEPTRIISPPGGVPAAVSSLPGLFGLLSDAGVSSELSAARDLPGQVATYDSEPLTEATTVTGAPTVSIRAASPTGTAVLFVKIFDVAPGGAATLPAGHVAPVRLTGLPDRLAAAEPVHVRLPAISHLFGSGHRIRIAVATTDQAYAGPREPGTYTVDLAESVVRLPTVSTRTDLGTANTWLWVPLGLAVLLAAAALAGWLLGRRRPSNHPDTVPNATGNVVTGGGARDDGAAVSEPPALTVTGLGKRYADGLVAVDHVNFVVRRGEIVGLLGPNGAGKTTTLRMLLGLIRPTAGKIGVFGQRVVPGAPVLSRVGALVEGPGLAPHLTGRRNLELFWEATGRPAADARLDEVLAIADLGAAVDRKVGKYSHGMKQRLAIAQAMLGLPDLLILDEPTDGLDPPQIAAMRTVLENYARAGDIDRAVLVSSHLLGEVEQTCTHVVVMHHGRRVAAGPVGDVVGESARVRLEVTDFARAEAVLGGLAGVRSVARHNGSLLVDVGELECAELVRRLVDAGVGVRAVSPLRRLEDAFLALVGERP